MDSLHMDSCFNETPVNKLIELQNNLLEHMETLWQSKGDLSAPEIIKASEQLDAVVRALMNKGIVHELQTLHPF